VGDCVCVRWVGGLVGWCACGCVSESESVSWSVSVCVRICSLDIYFWRATHIHKGGLCHRSFGEFGGGCENHQEPEALSRAGQDGDRSPLQVLKGPAPILGAVGGAIVGIQSWTIPAMHAVGRVCQHCPLARHFHLPQPPLPGIPLSLYLSLFLSIRL
jgi:hypothetical protein